MISHDNLNSLLQLAATSGRTDIAKMLVTAGADAYKVLEKATKKGNTKLVSTLLTAAKSSPASMPPQATKPSQAVIARAALAEAAKNGDIVQVKNLLETEVYQKNNALFQAGTNGNIVQFRKLLPAGAHLINENNDTLKKALKDDDVITFRFEMINEAKNFNCALHEALDNDHPEIVKMLLEAGAAHVRNFDYSSLIKAAANGNLDIVQALLAAGAPPSGRALERAASNGHLNIVQALLAHRAYSEYYGCIEGKKNALEKARQNGHFDVVKVLLTAYICQFNKKATYTKGI